jgi:hypothetical protein
MNSGLTYLCLLACFVMMFFGQFVAIVYSNRLY